MWLTVREYAKKVGKSVVMVYLDIRTGKIPKDKVQERPAPKKIMYILYEADTSEDTGKAK